MNSEPHQIRSWPFDLENAKTLWLPFYTYILYKDTRYCIWDYYSHRRSIFQQYSTDMQAQYFTKLMKSNKRYPSENNKHWKAIIRPTKETFY